MPLNIADGVVRVGVDVIAGLNRNEVERIVFPASVREIDAFVFADLTNLVAVTFNDGLMSIGTCAFRGCSRLESIELPASVVRIGGGAFRNCSQLARLSFRDGGVNRVMFAENSFAETANPADLRHLCDVENERRNARRLQKVYADVCGTAFFGDYRSNFEEAVARYCSIRSWDGEEELLRELFYERNNPVSRLMQGMFSEEDWRHFDRRVAVQICHALAMGDGDVGRVVGECRQWFDSETRRVSGEHGPQIQHRALFNRIVSSLLRDRQFVQIIDRDKLRSVADFLMGNGYLATYETNATHDDWYALSHIVFMALNAAIPNKSPYEIGVFGWCIAEVLRPEGVNARDEVRAMREVMSTSMREVGLLE